MLSALVQSLPSSEEEDAASAGSSSDMVRQTSADDVVSFKTDVFISRSRGQNNWNINRTNL